MLVYSTEGLRPIADYVSLVEKAFDAGEGLRLRVLRGMTTRPGLPPIDEEQRVEVLRALEFVNKHQASLGTLLATVRKDMAAKLQ